MNRRPALTPQTTVWPLKARQRLTPAEQRALDERNDIVTGSFWARYLLKAALERRELLKADLAACEAEIVWRQKEADRLQAAYAALPPRDGDPAEKFKQAEAAREENEAASHRKLLEAVTGAAKKATLHVRRWANG